MRSALLITTALLLLGCGDDSTTSVPSADRGETPTTQPMPTPTTVLATTLEEACWNATDAAWNSSVRLGLWGNPHPTADTQAEYYRNRVLEIGELIAAFERIGPGSIPASRWDAALADLASYAEWAQQNVDTIESTSDTVSDMSPDSIWSFRGSFGGACGDAFDIN